MRKTMYRMAEAEAQSFLRAAPVVTLAGTREDGEPVLRVVHAVVDDDALCFHGAPAGEKMEAFGRTVVVEASETVASIPSTFVDPERACPATTYYRSVQVHGVLRRVDDPVRKARVLEALMTKYQPEGGHVPMDPGHPRFRVLYAKAIAGLLVAEVPLASIDGKAKLGQNRTPKELARVVAKLWERGAPGDVLAVHRVLDANPGVPVPPFLQGPEGTTFDFAPDAEDLACIAPAASLRAHRASTAWVVARDAERRVVGSARGLSDGVTVASVVDVFVERGAPPGLRDALVRALGAHPSFRDVPSIDGISRTDATGGGPRIHGSVAASAGK